MNEQNGCFSSDNERDIRTVSFTKKRKWFHLFICVMLRFEYWQNPDWLIEMNLISSFFFFLTDAIDKGDSRRLGKKPVFTSSQVIILNGLFPHLRSFFIYCGCY